MPVQDDPVHAFMPYPEQPVPNAPSGPLSGLTLAVKDIFDVAGYRTGCGQPTMLALSDVKSKNAPIVQRFLDAGARFVGKTHTVELAYSLNGLNNHFGTPINAAAPDRAPGGSSSGSASATAARLCDIGLGSDTGGSVRGPASYQGLFGIRPTHGRLPLDLTMPLAGSLDTPGWFCRDAKTFERVGEAILGEDPHALPETPRLLKAEDCFGLAEPEPGRQLDTLVTRIDRMLAPVSGTTVAAPDFDALYWAFRWVQGVEAWGAHGAFIETWKPALGPGIGDRFEYGRRVTEKDAAEGRSIRESFRRHFGLLLGQDGVLLLPTMPGPAPLLAADDAAMEQSRAQSLRLLCLSGLSGFPQVTIPAGTHEGGPFGLSIIGPAGSDLSLVKLAGRISRAMAVQIA
ncbi:amidase [Alsobacter soli]|uniref:Amidase n=1 Tax=Alsobacter soli TaxID=2109933 RepID=A0A2T1HZS6_9HYPH|nr:amidase [Alsobacter soli]PSC07080.1 amidase [Alsobacter soli]